MISSLTSTDIANFWIRVYLGSSSDFAGAAIDRAYRDFNRTQHGLSKLRTPESYKQLKEVLRNITSQAITKSYIDQSDFDQYHQLSCDYLIDSCNAATGYKMFYGQAQKWINMSLKYMSALGDSRVPGISRNYQYFHIPIDNIIQDILIKKGLPRFKSSWSRIENYDDYLRYQLRFRELYAGHIPLDEELKLFNQLS
jgi:hypothetical protein